VTSGTDNPALEFRPALEEWLTAHRDELVTFRRHLHARPELSGKEVETTASIAERLIVAGLEPWVLPGGAGLVCDLGPQDGVPRVALRADIDALAMDDGKDVPYRSTNPGVAHACGHDVHTTAVLGAGLALHELLTRQGRSTPVRLIFQHAEERLPGGAIEIIAAGGLDGVATIYGLHCDPRLDVGAVGISSGPITSATDLAVIRLGGPGGHTARPERTVDLVRLTAMVAAELPGRVEARFDERPIRITFGAIHAGDAPNVIPSAAELQGTVRTPDVAVWNEAEEVMRDLLADLVAPYGATFELAYTRGHPPVVNDEAATERVARAAHEFLDDDAVTATYQSVGGDDFSWYLDRIPGCYVRLGVRDPDSDDPPVDLHASRFDVDERCLPVAIRLLAGATVRTLDDPSVMPGDFLRRF
jgi:amidohydrolase